MEKQLRVVAFPFSLSSSPMERGESSGSNSSGDDIWAKLVSVDSSCPDIELRSTEVKICSEMRSCSSEKQEWCKITRESDQISASMQNKSDNPIIVDGVAVQEDDATIVRCGSQIILGPESDGFRRYTFKVMPTREICKNQLKIILDPENAKCSICLSVWHDVVTVSPCLHNFCNGCFSMWLKRCQDKHSIVLCPQCRGIVQFIGRNSFLHSIEEDILKSDPSLRRSNEEIAHLNSYASIKLPDSSYTGGTCISSSYHLGLPPKSESLNEEVKYLRHTLVQQQQYIASMDLVMRRIALHANVDIHDVPPFQPQPHPDFEEDQYTDDDEEDEYTEDDDDDDDDDYDDDQQNTDDDDDDDDDDDVDVDADVDDGEDDQQNTDDDDDDDDEEDQLTDSDEEDQLTDSDEEDQLTDVDEEDRRHDV